VSPSLRVEVGKEGKSGSVSYPGGLFSPSLWTLWYINGAVLNQVTRQVGMDILNGKVPSEGAGAKGQTRSVPRPAEKQIK